MEVLGETPDWSKSVGFTDPGNLVTKCHGCWDTLMGKLSEVDICPWCNCGVSKAYIWILSTARQEARSEARDWVRNTASGCMLRRVLLWSSTHHCLVTHSYSLFLKYTRLGIYESFDLSLYSWGMVELYCVFSFFAHIFSSLPGISTYLCTETFKFSYPDPIVCLFQFFNLRDGGETFLLCHLPNPIRSQKCPTIFTSQGLSTVYITLLLLPLF